MLAGEGSAIAKPTQPQSKAPPVDNSTQFTDRLLEVHNRERVRMGQRPLTWSRQLAGHAQAWADASAARGDHEHAPPRLRPGEGEIVWQGNAGSTSVETVIGRFIGERSDFKPGVFPNVSRAGDWSLVGHYTQIIWPTTRELGCGMATARGQDFLVCRYAPEGNMAGQRVP